MGIWNELILSPRRLRPVHGYNSPAMNKPGLVYLCLMFCLVLPLTLLMMKASATPETPPLLVAANQGDRDISIIDPVAAKQLATVPALSMCQSMAAPASVNRVPTGRRWW
jgi:hypothetical protein